MTFTHLYTNEDPPSQLSLEAFKYLENSILKFTADLLNKQLDRVLDPAL